jgi:hypothetical protein
VNKIEGWDGHVLWLKVTEEHVKNSYERDRVPDTSTYYMKDNPDYIFPLPLPLIPLKLSKYEKELTEPPAGDVPRVYNCPLCNEMFKTEDELGKHMEHVGY